MFKNILIATDGSEASLRAARIAVGLAEEGKGSVVVMYALLPYRGPYLAAKVQSAADVVPDAALVARAEQYVSAVQAIATHANVPCETRVCFDANAVRAILRTQKECGCDLIAVGAHDHHSLAQIFHPQCVDALVTRSPVPVLVSRPGATFTSRPASAHPTPKVAEPTGA
jgi:nucleotide-binding universal stress UspA family protein